MFPLDADILIALGDSDHEHHQRCSSWFLSPEREAWATCPLTENAFVRILGHSNYPGFVGPADARSVLRALTAAPGHQFWLDALSVCDTDAFPRLTGSRSLTDLYLLGLAIARKDRFATLDERIDASLLPGGPSAYLLLPSGKP